MKWLITGGSGFTGKYLVSTIQKDFPNDDILILDVDSPHFSHSKQTKFKPVNLLNEEEVYQIISQKPPDRIIHLVGLMQNEDPLLMIKTNVLTCAILLKSIVSTKIPIDGFLVVGSVAQYGKTNPDNPPTEDDLCIPRSFYGYSKLLQEKLALEYHQRYNVPVICVRSSNLIGPQISSSAVVPRIVSQLVSSVSNSKSGKPTLFINHTKACRDFIDVRDISKAYIQLFNNPQTRGEIFNLGTNKMVSIMEIIEKAKELLNIDNLEIVEEKPSKNFDLHLTNSSKIRRFIPWEPSIKLEVTIKDMINALL